MGWRWSELQCGGQRWLLDLDNGEYITEVFGRKGAIIDALGLRTNKGKTFGEYGGAFGKGFSFLAPAGK